MLFVLITVEFLQSKRSKHCKLSGTELTKKNINHFQQRWQYHKMCICARSPASCTLQASLASLYKEATARYVEDARRCQKRLKIHDDIKWCTGTKKEMWDVLDFHGIVLAVLAACRHLNRQFYRPNPTGTLTQRPFYSNCLILLVQTQRSDSKRQNHEKTWSVAETPLSNFSREKSTRLTSFMASRYIIYDSIVFHYVPLVRICFNQSFFQFFVKCIERLIFLNTVSKISVTTDFHDEVFSAREDLF